MALEPVAVRPDGYKELAVTLADPTIARPAREVIRGLIERVAVRWEEGQAIVALDGALTALIGLTQNAKSPAGAGLDVTVLESSVKVVAGAGFEPAAFRL